MLQAKNDYYEARLNDHKQPVAPPPRYGMVLAGLALLVVAGLVLVGFQQGWW